MLFEAPEHVKKIKEIGLIYDVTDKIGKQLDADSEKLEKNLYLSTATEEKIAEFEKILNITKSDLDTFEDRRFRVKSKVYQILPYTTRTLKKQLNALCGEDGYELTIDIEKEELKCLVELKRKAMFNDVSTLLEDIVPLNIIIDLKLRYNQYGGTLPKYTYAMLSKYTCQQVREEVLELDARNRKI